MESPRINEDFERDFQSAAAAMSRTTLGVAADEYSSWVRAAWYLYVPAGDFLDPDELSFGGWYAHADDTFNNFDRDPWVDATVGMLHVTRRLAAPSHVSMLVTGRMHRDLGDAARGSHSLQATNRSLSEIESETFGGWLLYGQEWESDVDHVSLPAA